MIMTMTVYDGDDDHDYPYRNGGPRRLPHRRSHS